MESKYSDDLAQEYCARYEAHGEDMALRVLTSRLLGRDATLVLHGGGNTSVKTTMPDELGRPVEVLCVKGSGWDLADIEPPGLPAVQLQTLRDYRELESMSDEAMVNGVRRFLLNTASPNPSVETLLHAFLPHKFVDHTHADAVLALANQPDAMQRCADVFGPEMGLAPYIMPGFALAKTTAEIYEQNPDVQGLILINHGIFTFGDTARESYERMVNMVTKAEEAVAASGRTYVSLADSRPITEAPVHDHHLSVLRGALNRRCERPGVQLIHHRNSGQIHAFLSHPELKDIATRGTITPDHVIRTKQKPLIIAEPRLDDLEAFRSQVDQAVANYIEAYHLYFRTQRDAKGVNKREVHPLPIVFLIPGLGMVTAGQTEKAAKIAADLYEHTIDTILAAESLGRYQPLSDSDLFDMEYWSLEQAKLGKKQPPPMAGQVVLITGAAGGIGRATAKRFAAAGAVLVLTDLDQRGLDELSETLAGTPHITLAVDATDEDDINRLLRQTRLRFGGVDVLVSNAGMATSEPILEGTDALTKSLDVNLMAHQRMTTATVQTMLDEGCGGCLVFNASKSAFNPGPGFGAYAVAKAGLVTLMKQYAVEHASDGIRANAVNADRIRTGLFDEELVTKRAAARGLTPEAYFRANLLGVEVTADDVAEAFYVLVQARKTTGMVMTVDGGNIAASPR